MKNKGKTWKKIIVIPISIAILSLTISVFSFLLIISSTPVTYAANGLVVCKGATDTSNPSNTDNNLPTCDFNYLLIEGQTIINWLFVIAIPVAIVLFSYGGVLYIIGTQNNRTKANAIFTATGIGFGIMLIAWVSVYTVVNWLTAGNNGSGSNTTGVTTFLGQP